MVIYATSCACAVVRSQWKKQKFASLPLANPCSNLDSIANISLHLEIQADLISSSARCVLEVGGGVDFSAARWRSTAAQLRSDLYERAVILLP